MSYERKTFKGGTQVEEFKEFTNSLATVEAQAPARVYIPMSMHIGAPSKPLVAVGDEVKMGQKVAEQGGFVSVPAHSSVSGKVVDIRRMPIPNGRFVDTVVIENDFKDEWIQPLTRLSQEQLDALTPDELRAKTMEAGVVGMGGATFPFHVKYAPSKEGKKADIIILNGIECEPFLTADHRIMLERPEEIVRGLKYMMRMADTHKGVIAIEENKMDAFETIFKLCESEPEIEAVVCKEKYPEGSEKQLINAVTGREVPTGGLPMDVGVILNNVGTAVATCDAIELGRPLITRNVTLNGNAVNKPMNYKVRIGTLYKDLIELNGGTKGVVRKAISGGPMMGFAVYTLEIPIMKGTSGILLFNEQSRIFGYPEEGPCVRCGHCVDACPMRLEPTTLMKAAKNRDWAKAKAYDISSCMECGSCAYVCPSFIPIVQYIRLAKQYALSKDGNGAVNPFVQ